MVASGQLSSAQLNPITPGVSDQRLLQGGGGPLGPQSYFQLIWPLFWTRGTIIAEENWTLVLAHNVIINSILQLFTGKLTHYN